jgi:hypothetical protein
MNTERLTFVDESLSIHLTLLPKLLTLSANLFHLVVVNRSRWRSINITSGTEHLTLRT